MTAITHQRKENIDEITTLALIIYDGKTDEYKRTMMFNYAWSLANSLTVSQQRDWVEILRPLAYPKTT